MHFLFRDSNYINTTIINTMLLLSQISQKHKYDQSPKGAYYGNEWVGSYPEKEKARIFLFCASVNLEPTTLGQITFHFCNKIFWNEIMNDRLS